MGGGFGKKNLQGWERRSSGKFTILLVFLRKRRRWAFSLNKYASGLGSTNLSEGFFGLIFPTKRIFEPTVLLLKKAARCHPFLAVVRCLFHNHLRLKRSSLLNVYLNYKFEISLLTSHLFFSLFILMFTTSVGYRLGLLMSTTCLNCARFYDGVKLFSFKRVYIRFSNFCQLLAKSTRQNWFFQKGAFFINIQTWRICYTLFEV